MNHCSDCENVVPETAIAYPFYCDECAKEHALLAIEEMFYSLDNVPDDTRKHFFAALEVELARVAELAK